MDGYVRYAERELISERDAINEWENINRLRRATLQTPILECNSEGASAGERERERDPPDISPRSGVCNEIVITRLNYAL